LVELFVDTRFVSGHAFIADLLSCFELFEQ